MGADAEFLGRMGPQLQLLLPALDERSRRRQTGSGSWECRFDVNTMSTPVILPAGLARPSGWDGYEIFTVNIVRLTGLIRV
jgi:hypothetical protein